ncbi:MAG: RtcB family protein, partial [Caldilineaceae bacterium]|nr:RtcB family protein [Caldilineaceae bacterium]
MTIQIIEGVPVWGVPQDNAIDQILNCAPEADAAALMADHHLGYSVPIGGVVAYEDKLNPAGVGYDIACGNKAVRLDLHAAEVKTNIKPIMDDIWSTISFGVGRKNKEQVDHPLFDDDPAWHIPVARKLKKLAAEQLGTVGSGNHYVDIFADEQERVWIGVHFGSRGLGHRLATHFIKASEQEHSRRQPDEAEQGG